MIRHQMTSYHCSHFISCMTDQKVSQNIDILLRTGRYLSLNIDYFNFQHCKSFFLLAKLLQYHLNQIRKKSSFISRAPTLRKSRKNI